MEDERMASPMEGGGRKLTDKTDRQTKMRKKRVGGKAKRSKTEKEIGREGGRNKGALRQCRSGTVCVSRRRGFSLKFPIFISAANQRTWSISA